MTTRSDSDGPRAGGGAAGGRGSRPHVWPCLHCGMVEDYRLTRQSQLDHAEGAFRQDEDYRPVTFKQWLQDFQWETAPDLTDPAARTEDSWAASNWADRSWPGDGWAGDRWAPGDDAGWSSEAVDDVDDGWAGEMGDCA